jgi:hypothetical protein
MTGAALAAVPGPPLLVGGQIDAVPALRVAGQCGEPVGRGRRPIGGRHSRVAVPGVAATVTRLPRAKAGVPPSHGVGCRRSGMSAITVALIRNRSPMCRRVTFSLIFGAPVPVGSQCAACCRTSPTRSRQSTNCAAWPSGRPRQASLAERITGAVRQWATLPS